MISLVIIYDSFQITEYAYLYEDWNMIVEFENTSGQSSITHYIWNLDISGIPQEAGGVGGLVAVCKGGEWYIPLYDANGNITEYVNTNGTIVAQYDYDAFGRTVYKAGLMANDFKYRFSTKYYDDETGFYYYGYRYYYPEWGRWISRDPIEEEGGLNLYGFVGNDGVNKIDPHGDAAHILGGALLGCAGNAAWNLGLSIFSRDSFCQCSCKTAGSCAIGAVAGALAAAYPAIGGCIIGAGTSLGTTAVGALCDNACAGINTVKPECIAFSLIFNTIMWCPTAVLPTDAKKFLANLALNVWGWDLYAYCGLL